MKQVIQSFRTGELEVAEVPLPQCGIGMIRVQIHNSLISAGTEKMLVEFSRKSLISKAKDRPDLVKQVVRKIGREGLVPTLKKVFNKLDSPIPLGYSAAGIVTDVADDVTAFSPGDRVAVAGAGYANHAEFVTVPVNLAVSVPESVPFSSACYATVASIGLQGIRRASPELGECVVVLGLGLIGQLTVMMLKAAGCKVIGYDPDSSKIDTALKSGADSAFHENPEEHVLNITEGFGADSVIITASAPSNGPLVMAGELVKEKGTVVMVGMMPIEIPRDLYYRKELTFSMATSYGPGRYDSTYEEGGIDYPFPFVRWTEQRNMKAVVEMLESGSLNTKHISTHKFLIDDAPEAYDMIEKGSESYMGIILDYPCKKDKNVSESKNVIIRKEIKKVPGKIKTGFVGCGNFAGAVLIPSFLKNKEIHPRAIVSGGGYNALTSGRKFDTDIVCGSMEEMIEKGEVDAIVISTRHSLHAQQVVKALEAGIHVFVEKPLALNQAELTDVKKAINSSDAVLQVGYNRRFSPMSKKIRDAVEREKAPLMVEYSVNAGFIPDDSWLHDPLVGGGRIKGEVWHFIDLISFLCNSKVSSVQGVSISANGSHFRKDDNVIILLEYENGSTGSISYHAMGSSVPEKERVSAASGSVSAVLKDFRSLDIYTEKKKKFKKMSQEKGFLQEVDAFVNSIKKGNPAISAESLFNTSIASIYAEKSIKTKKRFLIH
ncbi:MAG: bi-domain-containing oxidoreductase [bacterium]